MPVHDSHKKIDTPAGTVIAACPVCGAPGELWRVSEAPDAPTTTAVMCSNGEAIGPQDGLINCGCLLYMAPYDFHRDTIREAVKYWNAFATALVAERRKHEKP